MQKLDIRLLKNLKQKLSSRNLQSIYLNALPQKYLNRIDLGDLNLLKEGLSKTFLDSLLTKDEFTFVLEPNSKIKIQENQKRQVINRLCSITIENDDHFEEQGRQTFGFGYPILLFKAPQDKTKIIKAPLLIWSLDIERNFKEEFQWIIKRNNNFSVTTNPGLTSFLYNQAGIKLESLYDQILEDSILDKKELAEMVFIHMKQLNPNISDRTQASYRKVLDGDISLLKTEKEINDLPLNSPQILWSGIFGLFRSQKADIVKDIDHSINNIEQLKTLVEKECNPEDPNKSSFMKHSFTLQKTDPYQQHILHSLDKGKNLIIQGPPGTGKSHTLSNVIANTLSNAGTCLVVCNKKSALEVIYKNLQSIGFEELAIIIEDEYRDRYKVVHSVLERSKYKHPYYRVPATFIRLLKSCASHVQHLQGYHNKLLQPLSGELKWIDIVGKYILYPKNYDNSILEANLKGYQFKFTTIEFDEIISVLSEGEVLFKKLGTLKHPMNALHDRFFLESNATKVESEIMTALENISQVVQSAQRDILTYLFEYEQLLDQHFSDVYLEKIKLTDKIIDLIENGLAQNKYYFNNNFGLYRNLMTRISNKYKKLDSQKIEVLETYFKLQKLQRQYNYFDFQFIDTSNTKKLKFSNLLNHIKNYKIKVYEWYDERNKIIQKLVKELGPNKIFKYVSFDKKVTEVSKNLDKFEQNFTNSKVFKIEFKFVTKNIRKRLTQVEDLDKNLILLKTEFGNFSDYHALKFFSLSLNEQQQFAFHGLVKSKLKDWKTSFSSWYLNALLAHHEDEFIPDDKSYNISRLNFKKENDDFQKMLGTHTLEYWRGKQSKAVYAFQKDKAPVNLNSLYNTRSENSARRTPLQKIINTSTDVFTSFYPVVLVSPEICSSILPLQPNLFDVVIFDEASQLTLEDTYCALMRGKYKIISGDQLQLPPLRKMDVHCKAKTDSTLLLDNQYSDANDLEVEHINYLSNSESLLEYSLAESTYHESFLELHYRSKHPYLIDFSNAAFYNNRLKTFPAEKNYIPIEFNEVGGNFIEFCNIKEATEIINYLLNLPEEENTCPSVAIVTFNIYQRNLISEKIQKKSIKDPLTSKKINLLKKNGLTIKNINNIQGEEWDIVLISTTFGLDENGKESENYISLKNPYSYKLLNVIVTRARHKVCVFNSIPSQQYENYKKELSKNDNIGIGLLYAYLCYAKAVNNQNDKNRKDILNELNKFCNKKSAKQIYKSQKKYFKENVIHFLNNVFPNLIIKTEYEYYGINLPIAILNDTNKVIIGLYFDVYHEIHSEEAYLWDIYHEERLKKAGITLYRIWSKEWWNDLNQGQQKLELQIREIID
ncbi:MAG: AAA domain-containing protein [Saprospiraceae bacterium]|nr:AAA domain-containing protein [Saprospiraceae bacterium]